MHKIFFLILMLTNFIYAMQPDLAKKAEIKELIEKEAKELPVPITADGNMVISNIKYDMEENVVHITALMNHKFFAPKPENIEKIKELISKKIAPMQTQELCNDYPMITLLLSNVLIKYEYVLDNTIEPFYTINITKKTCGYTGDFKIIGK